MASQARLEFREACRKLLDVYLVEGLDRDEIRDFGYQFYKELERNPQIIITSLRELQGALDDIKDANRRARENLEAEEKALAEERAKWSTAGILAEIKEYVKSPIAWEHGSAFNTAQTVLDMIDYYEKRRENGD